MIKLVLFQTAIIFLVDALDECNRSKDTQAILWLLTRIKDIETIWLCVFIASRLETLIRLGFCIMPKILHCGLVLNKVSRDVVNNDILVIFRSRFEEITNAFDLPTNWPSAKKISILIEKAAGLFIYAAIVCRFVETNSGHCPLQGLLKPLYSN